MTDQARQNSPISAEDLAAELRQANGRLILAGVRAQELAEQAIRQADQLNAVLESLREGVVVVDTAGEVVLVNQAARAILGLPDVATYTAEHYRQLDVRWLDYTPVPLDQRPLMRALRGERFSDEEVMLLRSDGIEVRLTVSGSAVQDGNGQVSLAVVAFRDVSELRRLEHLREEYVALISHDLRNPLTVLTGQAGWLHRLIERRGEDREVRAVDGIVKNARQMNAMIQDLLDSAHFESGHLKLCREPTDLAQLVRDIAARVGPAGDRLPIQIDAPESMAPVALDPGRIERAIVNLLVNARRYSPLDTPIVVRLRVAAGEAVVSVIDRGPGIAPEDVPHLFQRFYRAESGKKTGGLGLGLYITRMIVEAHGGRIWVESQPGQGSTFHFTLPVGT